MHIVGGTAGFWGTLILGPRIGFFGKKVINKTQKAEGITTSKNQLNY